MAVTYYDWTEHNASIRPDKVAILDSDTQQTLTYKQLNTRANQLGSWLQNNHVKKGDRVALLLPNCPEFFEAQFACSKIGAICLPLNWRLTAPELDYILKDSTPTVLLHDEKFEDLVVKLKTTCDIPNYLEIAENKSDSPYEKAIGESSSTLVSVLCTHDDTSMIMYTSGTTGHPKGALITHGMTFYNCVNLGIPAGISSKAIQLVVLPLFHTGGLNCYANPILHAGGQIVLMRDFNPGRALSLINDPELAITHFFAVPAPYQFMMLHPDFESTDLSRIQGAGVGGAPCAETILTTWLNRGVPLVQGWGMTETSPGGTALEADDALRKLGSAGKALMHTEIKVVDETGNE
ncbi:MAG: fatty-acyl-CoA synthase, partial [Candidatus Azotimanducaceae bacterium]